MFPPLPESAGPGRHRDCENGEGYGDVLRDGIEKALQAGTQEREADADDNVKKWGDTAEGHAPLLVPELHVAADDRTGCSPHPRPEIRALLSWTAVPSLNMTAPVPAGYPYTIPARIPVFSGIMTSEFWGVREKRYIRARYGLWYRREI